MVSTDEENLFIHVLLTSVHCLSTWKQLRNHRTSSLKGRWTEKPPLFLHCPFSSLQVNVQMHVLYSYSAMVKLWGKYRPYPGFWRSRYWDHNTAKKKEQVGFPTPAGIWCLLLTSGQNLDWKGKHSDLLTAPHKHSEILTVKTKVESPPLLRRWLHVSENRETPYWTEALS